MRKPSLSLNCILVTGATGGIGGALAQGYAAPGRALVLHGQDAEKLAIITAVCQGLGARVVPIVCDLRDLETWRVKLAEVCAEQAIDLAIVNAGVNANIGPDRQGEEWPEVLDLLKINVIAAMATVEGVLPSMRRRGSGQIALISSLAAFYGLPITPSYCASKAALKAYGESLRGWLAPEGIRVNVVMPGYVVSRMCRDMPGPKPFLWTAERAARVIRRRLANDEARIAFPFLLALGCRSLSWLPAAFSGRILRWLGYGG